MPATLRNIPYIGRSTRLSAGPDVMDRINRNSDVDLSADDVAVFEDFAANDQRMDRNLRLTRGALDRFAKHGREGRSVLLNHDDEKPIGHTVAGRTEDAKVRGQSGRWLVLQWYAVKKGASEQRRQRIRDVETGVIRYSSIGAEGGDWTTTTKELESGESVSFAEIRPEQSPTDQSLQLRELSRVHLGAVHGAGTATGTQSSLSADEPALELSNGRPLAVRPPAVSVYDFAENGGQTTDTEDVYAFASGEDVEDDDSSDPYAFTTQK